MSKTIKEMVEACLRNIPETRNSDVTLMIAVWKRYYPSRIHQSEISGQERIYLKDLYDLPREDNIKRVRAQFNSEGKYYPTDWKVAKVRGLKEDEWRVALGYPAKEATVHPTKSDSYMDEQRDFKNPSLFNR